MSDDAIGIIVGGIIGLLIWSWILYEIIKSATKSRKQTQLLEIQVRLLAELLIKQGVPIDRIMDIVNLEKKYFRDQNTLKK